MTKWWFYHNLLSFTFSGISSKLVISDRLLSIEMLFELSNLDKVILLPFHIIYWVPFLEQINQNNLKFHFINTKLPNRAIPCISWLISLFTREHHEESLAELEILKQIHTLFRHYTKVFSRVFTRCGNNGGSREPSSQPET